MVRWPCAIRVCFSNNEGASGMRSGETMAGVVAGGVVVFLEYGLKLARSARTDNNVENFPLFLVRGGEGLVMGPLVLKPPDMPAPQSVVSLPER